MFRDKLRKALAILVTAAMMLAPSISAVSAGTTGALETSMTASPSDLYPDQKVTDVELSVPSYDMTVSSDIVFALDISDCSAETTRSLSEMLERLHESAQSEKVNIKIGIVFFRGSSVRYLELTDLDKAYDGIKSQLDQMLALGSSDAIEASLAKLAAEKDPEYIHKGSNLHAGLQAAQKMLDEDTSVKAERKHMIAISDCITYMFNDASGREKAIYSGSSNGEASNLFYSWMSDYGIGDGYVYPEGQSWDDYFATVKEKVQSDAGQYDVDYRDLTANVPGSNYGTIRVVKQKTLEALGYKYLPVDRTERMSHASSIERGLYESWKTWDEMRGSGYQCYMVNPGYGSKTGTFPYLYTQMLNSEAGHTGGVDFEKITSQIVNAIESGTITFTIADEFELAGDAEKPFKVTLSGEEQACTADESEQDVWHYGEKDASGKYPYDLRYDRSTGKVELSINTPVENAHRIGLRFSLRLIPSPDTETTYPVTEGKAVLDYENSIDGRGTAEFPLASVTYHPPEKSTINVTAQVVWDDGEDASSAVKKASAVKSAETVSSSKRPDSVELQLYRNGEVYGAPVKVTADDGWKHVFAGLDEDYSWSVDEPDVPEGYTKTVEHSGYDWTITNTLKQTPAEPDDPSDDDDRPSTPSGENERPATDGQSGSGTTSGKVSGTADRKPGEPVLVMRREIPKTGDASEAGLWTALLAAAAVGAVAVSRRRKRS